jgi:signal peptidase I
MVVEFVVLILVALTIAFTLRLFLVQVFYIPSSSMLPTLEVDDRMVVEKLSYRFDEPQRGDVVVFRGESATGPVQRPLVRRVLRGAAQFVGMVPLDSSDLVKRVAGLPGEEIELIDGVLHVDGVAFDEPYRFGPDRSTFGPVVVPEGTLFFLGDNRSNSSDSRGQLGFVARERVVGRAVAVVWPVRNIGSLRGQRPVVSLLEVDERPGQAIPGNVG